MENIREINGGVTAAAGFRACGVHAGIKAVKPDMALVVSDSPAAVAGTFTTNKVNAAPVKLCRRHLSTGSARAFLVNSGAANACTGQRGMQDAERMAALASSALGIAGNEVFVCSTGTIGKFLPMDKIEKGVAMLVDALSPDGGDAAARAIMTTDTFDKQAAVEFTVDGKTVRLGGMTKGAGMICPNMATMLAFITTDAAVDRAYLQACLSRAVSTSFNRITVDGDESTNDTVLLMANGNAGNNLIDAAHPDAAVFMSALEVVAMKLARKIVEDGEGATKFVVIEVTGARSPEDATLAAKTVANSLLVKTSWFGCDPNWGRVIDAIGYSGAFVDENTVDIRYDNVLAVRNGMAAPGSKLEDLEAVLRQKTFTIRIDLHVGSAQDTVYTCDCSHEYVKINSEYMT